MSGRSASHMLELAWDLLSLSYLCSVQAPSYVAMLVCACVAKICCEYVGYLGRGTPLMWQRDIKSMEDACGMLQDCLCHVHQNVAGR